MDLQITDKKDNALFDRQDVKFVLMHPGEATPSRVAIRQLVAGELGTKTDNVIIDHMESATGRGATRGVARAYKNVDAARKTERVHLQKRNNIWKEKKTEEAEA